MKEAPAIYAETLGALRAWAEANRAVATIQEKETNLTYGFLVTPHRTEAKGFEIWIGKDGRFDIFCGAISWENDPIPSALALVRFCEAVADGKVVEREWVWRGRSMQLVTSVQTDDEWQPQWQHSVTLIVRIPLRFCAVVDRQYQPYRAAPP